MNVLIIGGGGREHALVDAIHRSPQAGKILCAPGNGGTSPLAENVSIDPMDFDGLIKLARERNVGLTVVGPEAPLCGGIVDRFQQSGLKIFGPSKAAARIEGDKAHAKELMRRAHVPTAEGRCFTRHADAKAYVSTRDTPQVVKAAGLAAGKGVIVCEDPADALLVLDDMMLKRKFGDAGTTVVVEERLKGREVSVLCLVDGQTLYILESAQDHKRLLDDDQGPNTGGMGAYSPTPFLDDKTLDIIQSDILIPIVEALRQEETPYQGLLYAGLMLTPGGPKVLEFNCRFGDPEAQAILLRLRSDPLEALLATVEGRLSQIELVWDERPSACVVMAARGYPEQSERGKKIAGLEAAARLPDVVVYHAGTKNFEGNCYTNGGRVLDVTAMGRDLAEARQRAYDAVQHIHFEGAQYRTDIGAKAEL